MAKLSSLILLIKSLSKPEKKAFNLYAFQTKGKKLYMDLYNIIDKEKYADSNSITKIFCKKHPGSSLAPNTKYLFELILQIIVDLNIKKNKEYELYNSYLITKVLRERDLYNDYLSLVQETKKKAKNIGDYNLLLTLQREELKDDSLDSFYHLKEDELFKKERDINENLKVIRQINEQSFLYEILRFKIERQKLTETSKSFVYDDLLISEMTLVSNLKNEIFEINRLHQLFQASYFISIGSYKNALNSFSELNRLYINNEAFWNNNPIHYVMILEGVLESLNRMKLFDEMSMYKKQLSILTQKYPYVNFVLEVNTIEFLYSVTPYMYNNKYKECLALISQYQDKLIDKLLFLPPKLFIRVSISLSGIYLVNRELVKAREQLVPVIRNSIYSSLKDYRAAQLLDLIIHYESEDIDSVEAVIRSIKRKNKKSNRETQIEKFLFFYLETEWKIQSKEKNNALKGEFRNKIMQTKFSIEDLQLIRVFDFSEWILNKLTI